MHHRLWTPTTHRWTLWVEVIPVVRPLRCLRGRHDWQRFEAPEGEVGRRCARCGELDWPDREPESHGPRDRDWKTLVDPG